MNNADRFGFGDAVPAQYDFAVSWPRGIAQPFKFETGEDVLPAVRCPYYGTRRASNRSNPVARMMLPTVTVMYCSVCSKSIAPVPGRVADTPYAFLRK